MPQRAKRLYMLQQVDIQLALKKRRYDQVEAKLGENQLLREARAALNEAQQEQGNWRSALREREAEVANVAEKLEKDEESLYSGRITSPKELSNLQKETEYLKRRKAELEDKQLDAMLALEQATAQVAVANEQYVVVEANWRTENAELGQEYETLKEELIRLLAQRKALVQHISEDDLNRYMAIRRLRKGVAVAAVRDGMCKACSVEIPQRDLQKAGQTDDLYFCSGCERILYVNSST